MSQTAQQILIPMGVAIVVMSLILAAMVLTGWWKNGSQRCYSKTQRRSR